MGSCRSSVIPSRTVNGCTSFCNHSFRTCHSYKFLKQTELSRNLRRSLRARNCGFHVECQSRCAFGRPFVQDCRRNAERRHPASRRPSSTVMNAPTGGKDFFAWLLDLPWKRFGIWALVVLVAYQLKDFFGVSECLCFSLDPYPCPASTGVGLRNSLLILAI